MKAMNTPRYNCAHAVLSGLLFLIGGVDEQRRLLTSVEYYVPLTGSWHTVAAMHRGRQSASACASNGFIFVFGGWHTGGTFQSIERYDPRENTWTEVILYKFVCYIPTEPYLLRIYISFSKLCRWSLSFLFQCIGRRLSCASRIVFIWLAVMVLTRRLNIRFIR